MRRRDAAAQVVPELPLLFVALCVGLAVVGDPVVGYLRSGEGGVLGGGEGWEWSEERSEELE